MRKSRVRATAVAVGTALLVAGCGGGGDSGGSGSGGGSDDPVPVGEPADFTHGDASGTVTVTSVRRIAEAEQPPGVALPPESGSFLVVGVTISVDEGTLLYNGLDFRLPLDGDDFDRSLPIVLGDTSLGSGELSAGDEVSGEVAFDVPEGSVVIDYAPQAVPGAALLEVEG